MRISSSPCRATPSRRGAALMLSFLVLIVLILIVSQISYSAKTDARVTRNEETLKAMDLAIESVLLQTYEDLANDSSGGGGPFGAGGGGGGSVEEAFGESGGASGGTADSREDDWAQPKRTELNDLQLRVFVQDEDSKFNLLSIITENEDEAQKAYDRLVRVLQLSRSGTRLEIDAGDARLMATRMLEYMNRRRDQVLPITDLLTNDPENDDIGLPLTLRELTGLDREVFPPDLFRDLRDEEGVIVHSLSSFITVHSSLTTADELFGEEDDPDPDPEPEPEPDPGGPGTGSDPFGGGGGEQPPEQAPPAEADGKINLNTAPPAVLRALLDDRELPYRFWDDVVEYRNEPQEDAEDRDPELVQLDEFGEEIVPLKFFGSLESLEEIGSWDGIEPATRAELLNLLKVQSSVFSIYVTARRPTGEERIEPNSRREDIEREEAEGQGLVRTVRSVVWRRESEGGEVEIVPIVRWEVVDYVPWEVLDYPRDER